MTKKLSVLATLLTLCNSMSAAEAVPFAAELAPLYGQKQSYTACDYSHLLGAKGFSDALLQNHFKLYQGYVANCNATLQQLNNMPSGPAKTELRRRLGWEFSGMRLHELYFENMTSTPQPLQAGLFSQSLEAQWGSFAAWKEAFLEVGATRGIGWAVLSVDPQTGRLFNTWIGEHDMGQLAATVPLLVMDVWEHAYLLDYHLDRSAYLQAFFAAIDWKAVQMRYSRALRP
jgi:Fe-Mn family superoxide dismutase